MQKYTNTFTLIKISNLKYIKVNDNRAELKS